MSDRTPPTDPTAPRVRLAPRSLVATLAVACSVGSCGSPPAAPAVWMVEDAAPTTPTNVDGDPAEDAPPPAALEHESQVSRSVDPAECTLDLHALKVAEVRINYRVEDELETTLRRAVVAAADEGTFVLEYELRDADGHERGTEAYSCGAEGLFLDAVGPPTRRLLFAPPLVAIPHEDGEGMGTGTAVLIHSTGETTFEYRHAFDVATVPPTGRLAEFGGQWRSVRSALVLTDGVDLFEWSTETLWVVSDTVIAPAERRQNYRGPDTTTTRFEEARTFAR